MNDQQREKLKEELLKGLPHEGQIKAIVKALELIDNQNQARFDRLEKTLQSVINALKAVPGAITSVSKAILHPLKLIARRIESLENRIQSLEKTVYQNKEELTSTIQETGDSIVEQITEHQKLIGQNIDDISRINASVHDLEAKVN